MKKAFCDRFEEELSRIQASLGKPRGRKQYDKIIERIGKAKEKHKRISGCYDTEVIASEDGKTATKIQWKKKEESIEKRLNGHYFLRTNLTEHTAEDLWNFYNSIRTVEEAFRFMKSSLGMRPVYHRKEARVDGHLWITVLAYHLIRSCLYQLQQQGVLYHWPTIRNRMSSRIRTTTMVKTDDDQVLHLRTTTQAEQGQKEIYHALNMSPQIMKTNKTVFKL
jgi:transposase